jgi:hypothetical protein
MYCEDSPGTYCVGEVGVLYTRGEEASAKTHETMFHRVDNWVDFFVWRVQMDLCGGGQQSRQHRLHRPCDWILGDDQSRLEHHSAHKR